MPGVLMWYTFILKKCELQCIFTTKCSVGKAAPSSAAAVRKIRQPFFGWCFNATSCCLRAWWWWALSSQESAWHPQGSGVESAARRPQDSSTTRVAPARGADSVWILRWTRALTGLSTRTMDEMIGNDGPTVSLTAPVSVTGTSAVSTAAAVDTDGPEPTVTNE